MRVPLALLGLVLLPGAAGGEIYRWTDEGGALHFTESLDQVPARHRAAARDAARAPRPDAVQRLQTYTPAALASPPRTRGSERTLQIPFERYGNLMLVAATLNDHLETPLLVDTGASGVALPPAVVERLGIPIGPDTQRIYVSTANGMTRLPLVEIDSVEIGGARVEKLTATVNPTLEVGLLGGAFLNHFVYNVDAAARVLTLQPSPGMAGGLGEEEWRRRFRAVREPLESLEAYLDEKDISREGRRAELEERRDALRAELDALVREANDADVPRSWRE